VWIYLLPTWSRVLLEKLTGFQPVKKFSAFCGNRRFITHSKLHTTFPYPEPARSSPYPTSYFLKIHLIFTPIYAWVSQMVSFPQVSPPKLCIRLSSPHMRYMLRRISLRMCDAKLNHVRDCLSIRFVCCFDCIFLCVCWYSHLRMLILLVVSFLTCFLLLLFLQYVSFPLILNTFVPFSYLFIFLLLLTSFFVFLILISFWSHIQNPKSLPFVVLETIHNLNRAVRLISVTWRIITHFVTYYMYKCRKGHRFESRVSWDLTPTLPNAQEELIISSTPVNMDAHSVPDWNKQVTLTRLHLLCVTDIYGMLVS